MARHRPAQGRRTASWAPPPTVASESARAEPHQPAAALSARVLSGELAEGARVKLVHYAMNEIASVRLCMVTKIDVHEAKGGRIGVPRRYDGSSCDDVRTLAVLKAHFSEPDPPPPPKAKARRA